MSNKHWKRGWEHEMMTTIDEVGSGTLLEIKRPWPESREERAAINRAIDAMIRAHNAEVDARAKAKPVAVEELARRAREGGR